MTNSNPTDDCAEGSTCCSSGMCPLKDAVQDFCAKAGDYIRQFPVESTAIAFALGLLLGKVISSSCKKDCKR